MQTPTTSTIQEKTFSESKSVNTDVPSIVSTLVTPTEDSYLSPPSSSVPSPPLAKFSPNHHNYYTTHLNKAQFNSILINCSVNLLKILYTKKQSHSQQAFDEKSVRCFILEILRRSKTSIQTLQLSSFYLYKLIVTKKDFINLDPKKLFLGLIIVASKFNQDYNYSFRSWCKICGLNESYVANLRKIEFEILNKLDYELSLINKKYENWCNLLLIFGYDFIKYQLINDDKNDIFWDDKINEKISSWHQFFIHLSLNSLDVLDVNFTDYFKNQLNKKVFIVDNESILNSTVVASSSSSSSSLSKKRAGSSLFNDHEQTVKKIKV
ncbi:MAG: cyclin [Asgard group archaeon]|nr:cyclin [Asgard group archaeon]